MEFHTEFVALLAACADGDNHSIESVCRSIIDLDELLSILADSSMPHHRKSSYLRLECMLCTPLDRYCLDIEVSLRKGLLGEEAGKN